MVVANEKVRHLRYEPLRKQLSEIPYWPHRYCHKIIGKNANEFLEAIKGFEEQFPQIKKTNESESRNGTYISLTYELEAQHVDEIILLWVVSEELPGCVKIL